MFKRLIIINLLLLSLAGCGPGVHNISQLRVQISNFPESFSPVKTNEFDGIVFQFLTERDSTDKLVSNLVDISEKISINDTITLFGFALKESAKWYDGTPVSREDVNFSLKINRCGLSTVSSAGNFHLSPITSFIEDPNDERAFQLQVRGNAEYGRAIAGDFLVMPEHVFDPQGILRQYDLAFVSEVSEEDTPEPLREYFDGYNAIPPYDSVYFKGSGPYQIESYYPGQSITLALSASAQQIRNGAQPLPEKINYLLITDPTAARFAIQNDEVDLITQVPATEFVQLEAFNKKENKLNLYKQASFKFVFLGFNVRQEKLKSASTRIALAHMLDVQSIMEAVRLGYAEPTVGPVHPVLSDLYNDKIEPYPFEPDTGRALLQKAGWRFASGAWKNPAGEELAFSLTYNGANSDYQKIALIVQDQMKKLGVNVTLLPEEAGNLNKQLRSHQFDATIYSFVGSPRAFDFTPLFHSASTEPGKLNFVGFGNDQSDKAIENAILATDRAELGRHLKDLQAIIHQECPMVFLYYEQSLIAASKKFPRLNISYYRPGYDPVGFY